MDVEENTTDGIQPWPSDVMVPNFMATTVHACSQKFFHLTNHLSLLYLKFQADIESQIHRLKILSQSQNNIMSNGRQ